MAVSIALVTACFQGDYSPEPETAVADCIDPAVVKTPEDKLKAETLLNVTKALRELYKTRTIVEEVNAAIATGYYADETVLLKDLLNPGESPIYKMESFVSRSKTRNFRPGSFKIAFESAIGIESDAAARTNNDFFVQNGISIYFPYSEDTQYTNYITTVGAATVEADQMWVAMPYGPDPDIVNPPGHMSLVNDSYASVYPTHIVGMGAEQTDSQDARNCTGSMRIDIGYVKILSHQYDNLVSFSNNGGGAELRFIFANPRADGGSVTGFSKEIHRYVKRGQARNQEWVAVQQTLDNFWDTKQTSKFFGIYERDFNQGTKTFSGSMRYTDTHLVTSTYSLTVLTREPIVDDEEWYRSSPIYWQTTFGHTAQYLTGYGPQFTSDDTYVVFSRPIQCY